MKILSARTIKVGHPNPSLGTHVQLFDGKEIEVDDAMGNRIIEYGYGKKVSAVQKTVEKVVKKVSKSKNKK